MRISESGNDYVFCPVCGEEMLCYGDENGDEVWECSVCHYKENY